MPFYLNDDDATLHVDFGNGRSLTLKLRAADMDIETIRRLAHQHKQSELINSRIENLENKVKLDNLSAEEFDKVMDELRKLGERPDQLQIMVDYVWGACCGWTDYFANPQAEAKGEVVPYTKENISKMGIGALAKVVTSLQERFNLGDDTGKAQTSLPRQSRSEDRDSLTLTSTSN